MPLYVYVCPRCQHRFEELVFGSEAVHCPQCRSTKTERQLSTFAVHGGGAAPACEREPASFQNGASPCGSCGDPRGPGACAFEN
ncbi:MAG: zinc ribbon domain-containing protein [Planctomycetes bacterium]|nr:zinc ribbon domain-containing protein [Planctomycetota bacterium]